MERAGGSANRVEVTSNGPLQITGEIELVSADDELISVEATVALCRCGASRHKPFCDGSHDDEGFLHGGELGESHNHDCRLSATGNLVIRARRDGPYLLSGPVTITSADGADHVEREKVALCRCGASENKPFCDGSHRSIEFLAD